MDQVVLPDQPIPAFGRKAWGYSSAWPASQWLIAGVITMLKGLFRLTQCNFTHDSMLFHA